MSTSGILTCYMAGSMPLWGKTAATIYNGGTAVSNQTDGAIRNIREVISGTLITGTASVIKLAFQASDDKGNWNISGVGIGIQDIGSNAFSMTKVTFGGSGGIVIPSGQTMSSDAINFVVQPNVNYLVHVYMGARYYKLSSNGNTLYYNSTASDGSLLKLGPTSNAAGGLLRTIVSNDSPGLTLYEQGSLPSSGLLTLYTVGSMPSGTLSLYTEGKQLIDEGKTLFISGAYPTIGGALTLYIGTSGLSSYVYLYTVGTGKKPISIKPSVPGYMSCSDSATLFIGNSSSIYSYGQIPIYLDCAQGSLSSGLYGFVQGGTALSSGLTLFASGTDILTDSLYLYTHGY